MACKSQSLRGIYYCRFRALVYDGRSTCSCSWLLALDAGPTEYHIPISYEYDAEMTGSGVTTLRCCEIGATRTTRSKVKHALFMFALASASCIFLIFLPSQSRQKNVPQLHMARGGQLKESAECGLILRQYA